MTARRGQSRLHDVEVFMRPIRRGWLPIDSFLLVLLVVLAALVGGNAVAQDWRPDGGVVVEATETPPPILDPTGDDVGALVEFFRLVYLATTTSNWFLLSALALVAVVAVLRKYGASRWPWLGTDRAGVVSVFALSTFSGVALSIAGGAPFTVATVLASLKVGLGAIGIFAGGKKALFPKKQPPPGIAGLVPPPRVVQ